MKCKNCKVTLAPYLDKCPLCGLKQEKQNDNSVYSSVVENFSTKINIIYFSRLIMKILLLSNIICMIVNLAINNKISWSLYVLGSTQYIFSYYLYLILSNKKIAFIINMISLEIYLFMIAYLTNSLPWFLYLVGPFIALIVIFILLNVYLSKFRNILRNFSCILIYISFCLNMINGCISFYKSNSFLYTWSIKANIPLLIISLILILLSFNRKICEEVEKRFFI